MSGAPAPAKPAVEMVAIRRYFPGVKALKGVSLSVQSGEIHALLGENGAGKSTLVKILCGAEHMDSGKILLAGEEVRISEPVDALAKGIAIVYQEMNLAGRKLIPREAPYAGTRSRRLAAYISAGAGDPGPTAD